MKKNISHAHCFMCVCVCVLSFSFFSKFEFEYRSIVKKMSLLVSHHFNFVDLKFLPR